MTKLEGLRLVHRWRIDVSRLSICPFVRVFWSERGLERTSTVLRSPGSGLVPIICWLKSPDVICSLDEDGTNDVLMSSTINGSVTST